MKASEILDKNKKAWECGKFRIIANKGGTRSTKTWSLLQLFLFIATNTSEKILMSVVSESMPHLRKGALRDFLSILDKAHLIEDYNYKYNRTGQLFIFPNGNEIEFFSADTYTKVHGAQRDYLFLNECNNLEWEIYRQLAVRTSKTIFLDWNPRSSFWYDDKLQGRSDCILIHSTYKDNPFLSASQVSEIESYKNDDNWWRIYGLGENGISEGLIYTNWEQVQEIPGGARLIARGLDFGFTNDPTAIVAVYEQSGELWLDEECYGYGMTNDAIASSLKSLSLPYTAIVADSAEMKSIAEIRNYGVRNIEPAIKGADSVRNGIQIVQRHKLNVTQRSLNLIKELRNYQWAKDRISGEWRNEPNKSAHFDHALDAVRYVCLNKLAQRRAGSARASIGRMY